MPGSDTPSPASCATAEADTPKVYDTTLSNGYPARLERSSAEVLDLSYDVIVEDRVYPTLVQNRLLSPIEADALLRKNELKGAMQHCNGMGVTVKIWWDCNNLPMKDEDRSSVHTFKKGSIPYMKKEEEELGTIKFWRKWQQGEFQPGEKEGSYLLASVFDGVQESYAAELINRALHPCIAYAMMRAGHPKTLDKIGKVLVDTFQAIGNKHQRAPITHSNPDDSPSYDFLPPGTAKMMSPGALFNPQTGTTSVTVMVDLEAEQLYVANLGNCRAVAGWYSPSTGQWECDVLTEDMTPENPEVAKRLLEEHAETPPGVLIQERGLPHGTFGNGPHTRSFAGPMQTLKNDELGPVTEATGKPIPRWYIAKGAKQQPYVSHTPKIQMRDLRHDARDQRLKFVILASDGIWDRITSEEAVLLTAAYLEKKAHDPISKKDLPGMMNLRLPGPEEERPYPAQPFPGTAGRDKGHWVFEDTSASTHLIRNALGDGDAELRRAVLSLTSPEGRDMRDDMTATVLFISNVSS